MLVNPVPWRLRLNDKHRMAVPQTWWLAALLLMVLAACSPAAGPTTQPERGSSPAPVVSSQKTATREPVESPPAVALEALTASVPEDVPPEAVPMVDVSLHDVPLEDIVFDTFGGFPRFVPLSEASEKLILDLRDAITPVAKPVYGGPDSLPWLKDTHLVMGYRSGDSAFAYPINVLNVHEIVNDVIDGVPLVVTYCPLCFSGVVFSRELDGRLLTFGNTSALYQSDLVMYDHQTGSYWFQVGGEAVVGAMTGARLNLLPSTTMEWGDWRRLNPETQVLMGTAGDPDRFTARRYRSGLPGDYQARINREQFVFPVDEEKLDARLPAGEIVVTVEIGTGAKAYPLSLIGDGAVNDSVGGMPVVLLAQDSRRAAAAFSPVVPALNGMALTFDYAEDRQAFVDENTGSVWDLGGMAFEGPLAGVQLKALNTRRAFWFSIAIAFPGMDVYIP